MAVSLTIAIAGCFVGYRLYTKRRDIPERLAQRFPAVYRFVFNKYYVDELYQATVVRGLMALMRFLAAFDAKVIDGVVNLSASLTKVIAWISGWFDKLFVDGIVNKVAEACSFSGMKLRLLQTGRLQNYVYVLVAGVVVFMFWRIAG